MLQADEKLIRWLLEESGVSKHKISSDTGIVIEFLNDIIDYETKLQNMTFSTASDLTVYAMVVKGTGEVHKMRELWLKDYRGGYTLLHSRINLKPMDVEYFLRDLGDKTLDKMAEALGYDIRELKEGLTTERPKYLEIRNEGPDVIILKNEDIIENYTWNGETWNDNNRQYAPVYEWIGVERNSTYLIGVVEV